MTRFGTLLHSTLVLAVAVLALLPSPAEAQIRASEPASVSQTVDGTVITVDYSRPRARGRTELFGGEVHWGEVWTPGANDATVLELSKEVEIEGHTVPAGRWSVWMVVAEEDPWELVLDPRDTLFHTQRPEISEEQIRFPVGAREGQFVDVLTWSFPRIRNDGTTLAMAWGAVRVPLEVKVQPTMVMTVEARQAGAYVGDWILSLRGGPPGGEPPPPSHFRIRHEEDGKLVAHTTFQTPEGPVEDKLLLAPVAEGIFRVALLDDDGELLETLEGFLEFEIEDDRAVAFTIRGAEDEIFGTGEREP